MSLNSTPASGRVHIGIYGRRNAGKSSLINALTGQELAIVSDVAGTTTDPVSKAMELLPLGPVVLIDTAGLDDEGELGVQRVRRSMRELDRVDIVLLVLDGNAEVTPPERALLDACEARGVTCLLVRNKSDQYPQHAAGDGAFWVSAKTGENISALRERIASLAQAEPPRPPIIADLLAPGDLVVLVTPIDASAPKGRLILPQQQTIRDILDAGGQALVTKEDALEQAFSRLRERPRMVVTDSQAFEQVAAVTPLDVPLTSFSILFARHGGVLKQAAAGAAHIDDLRDGDTVLISEGCTHHRQCEDIGTVKLPRWISQYTGKELRFSYSSGNTFPDDLRPYRLVVHCGACMLPPRALQSRLRQAMQQGVPMTNFGILIAQMKGILQRSLAVFPAL